MAPLRGRWCPECEVRHRRDEWVCERPVVYLAGSRRTLRIYVHEICKTAIAVLAPLSPARDGIES